MSRRHFILGAVALAVAAVVAVVRPGQAPPTQVVSAVQTPTTTTTIDPTRPTVTFYLGNEKQTIVIPPPPPGVQDPIVDPKPGEGVTNIHCRVASLTTSIPAPACPDLPPVNIPPIEEILAMFGITTTTMP